MAASDELTYSSTNSTTPNEHTSNQLKQTKMNSGDLATSLLYLTSNQSDNGNCNFFMQNLVNNQESSSHPPFLAYQHLGQESQNLSEPSSPTSSAASPLSNSSGHISIVNSLHLSNYYLIIFYHC